MSMSKRFLILPLLAVGLLPVAHAEYRVTAFGGTPGFAEIMAADYDGARDLLAARYTITDRYARYANLCVSLLKSGELDAALDNCERALSVAPADLTSAVLPMYHKRSQVLTHLYSNRGVVRAVSGDLSGARGDFERALRLDDGNANARRNLEVVSGTDLALRVD